MESEDSLPHLFAPSTSLFWARSIQFMPPHLSSRRSSLIESSYVRLGIPSGLLSLVLPTKTHYASLMSPIHKAWHAQLVFLDLITGIIAHLVMSRDDNAPRYVFFYILLFPRTSWGSNIVLSPLSSNTLSLFSSLHVKDQVSHPYKKWAKL